MDYLWIIHIVMDPRSLVAVCLSVLSRGLELCECGASFQVGLHPAGNNLMDSVYPKLLYLQ